MSYNVSMRQIASAAGVSVSTVSLAFRNSPKISKEKKEAIQLVASRLGYTPDPKITELMEHLRASRRNRTVSNIAMIIPELNSDQLSNYPPILGLIEGARNIAESEGFNVDVFYLKEPGMTQRRLRQILLTRGIRGIIIAPFASGVGSVDFDCTDFCVATAGYSIVEPRLHRACPNYLQMMDELIDACVKRGYKRIGLAMTYNEGGVGHKLYTSSFLFWQTHIASDFRIPILPKPQLTPECILQWFKKYKPEVIISSGAVFDLLTKIGLQIPKDVAFASIDISQKPNNACGADHRYSLVGREAFEQVLSLINLNITGLPVNPKTVLVDSHMKNGFTLPDNTDSRDLRHCTKSSKLVAKIQ